MKRKVTILQGQLQNFILFSLKDKGELNDLYWGPNGYRRDLSYEEKYEWGYSKEDKKVLEEFLNGD